jgi:hypothetical protein
MPTPLPPPPRPPERKARRRSICGTRRSAAIIDMRIARDGTWFYLGTPIGRAPLVKLFSSILKREGDDYFLVTPVEKVGIKVDDAPLLAVDFDATGEGHAQTLTFTTKTEDEVVLGPDHPLRVTATTPGEPSPYVLIRAGSGR